MKLWRIAADTRRYAATDLSGTGAALMPGRWNDTGESVVYAAPTISMAVLETAAHIGDAGLPLNRFLLELEVPEGVWAARQGLMPEDLPVSWSAVPAGQASVKVGSDWLRSLGSAILMVPSVIVPEEPVALINPHHPESRRIVGRLVRPFEYNRVLRT